MKERKFKNGTIIKCVTDASNFGQVTIQRGKIRGKFVDLEDGTTTTLWQIRNIFNNTNLGIWSEYNPILKKWRKIRNIKIIKEVR